MQIIRKKAQLVEQKVDPKMIVQIAQQLQKDFLTFSIILWESEAKYPQSWEGIYDDLRPVVDQLLERDSKRLVQIFYRMDLSEKLLKESLAQESGEQTISEITVMMIYREWLKVKFRSQYSSPEKNKPQLDQWSRRATLGNENYTS